MFIRSTMLPVQVSKNINKSSAVAEMGDRAHNTHGPKRQGGGGGLLCPFRGGPGSPWAEVYFHTKWRLHPSSRLVPKETLTHPPFWSSSNLYQLLPSTTIHSILPVQITCLAMFSHNFFPCRLWSTSWSGDLYLIFHISSPNQCLLFATNDHTIATYFAVVSILYHLFLVFLSTPYLELHLLP